MSIKGWPTQEKDDRLSPQYATVEPVRQLQQGLSVLSHEFVREVGTDSVEANSTTTVINATAHAAQVGDVIRLTSGALSGQEIKVYSVATNSITLAEELASAPALGVTFQILRHKYPLVEPTGEVKVTATFTEVATAADGGALPALTKVVSGYDGSAVQVLKTDAAGELQVDVLSSALPTGAATEATLLTIDADTSALAGCVGGTELQVDVVSSALPTGAATEVTLADIKTSVELIDDCVGTDNTAAPAKSLVVAGVTAGGTQQTVEVSATGHVHISDGGGSITVDATSWPLPTGAATAAKQPALGTAGTPSADVISVQGLAGMVPLQVDGSNYALQVSTITTSIVPGTSSTHLGKAVDDASGGSDTGVASLVVRNDSLSAITPANNDYTTIRVNNLGRIWANTDGRTATNRARIDYSSTSVSTTAYTQLLASTSAIIQEVEIFDSSGQTLFLATGASGSEVDQVYIFPGGNGRIPLYIANATRVAIKAVSALANSGEIAVNFYS